MKRFGKSLLFIMGGLAVAWMTGNLLLEVQLPDRSGRREGFPDPMNPDLSLREVFDLLPDGGGEEIRVSLLDDNSAGWVERWRLLAAARERLDIGYFILKQDIFGMAFLGHILHKAHEGLDIRILLDAMGTRMSRTLRGNDYLDTLVNTKKIAVRIYRPLPFRYLDAFLTLNPAAILVSNHDKILLADGMRGLIGGRNISSEYFTSPDDDPQVFRDTDILLVGPMTGERLETIFEAQYMGGEAHMVEREELDLKDSTDDLLLAYRVMDAWLRGGSIPSEIEERIQERDFPWLEELRDMPHLRGALEESEPERTSAEVRLVDSRCRLMEADDFITRSLIRLVRSAREEVFIQSPYLVLPEEAADILEEAAARGVKITVLTNSPLSSDNAMSQGVFLEQWPELLARVPGLRIYVAGDRHNLHSKLAVFDGRLALVGTYNLDPLSMALNSELVAAAWSSPLAGDLLQSRRGFIAQGSPLIYEYRIKRDAEGNPLRDDKGRAIVHFGPEDHIPPEEMTGALRYRKMFRWGWRLFKDSPLF
jgi:phosphatidylserine/phosphatidylglycerophosphate/cardiolipin synthase-like enzyme